MNRRALFSLLALPLLAPFRRKPKYVVPKMTYYLTAEEGRPVCLTVDQVSDMIRELRDRTFPW